MVEIRLTLNGIEGVLRKTSPDLWRPAIAEMIQSAALLAEKKAKEFTPKDTHALARSVTSDVKDTSATVYSTLAYALPVEEGRRAGATMPPPDALRGWMMRHGLSGVSPFVIARAIQRRGIKGRFFMKRAMEAVKAELPALAQKAFDDIGRRWSS